MAERLRRMLSAYPGGVSRTYNGTFVATHVDSDSGQPYRFATRTRTGGGTTFFSVRAFAREGAIDPKEIETYHAMFELFETIGTPQCTMDIQWNRERTRFHAYCDERRFPGRFVFVVSGSDPSSSAGGKIFQRVRNAIAS